MSATDQGTRPVYLNGRILARPQGGVRRYATQIAPLLTNCTVVAPARANHPWSARIWEQRTLERTTRAGVLLNVAHSGPLHHRRHVTVVHDLFALTSPRSVNPAFAALTRLQLPRLIRSARHVVTVSTAVADEVAAHFAVPAARLSVVPPGIAAPFMAGDRAAARMRLGLSVDMPVVVALLDPTPRKNSGDVVTLLRRLQQERPKTQIVVAGGATPAAFARTAAPSRRKNPRTGFKDLGAAADIQLASMFQAADVFVSLSNNEGFGLPMVEAARCGASVVTATVPSIVEHAPDAALIVDNKDEAYRAVLSLLDNADQRDELAHAAKALGDLRWTQTAARLDDILNAIARS